MPNLPSNLYSGGAVEFDSTPFTRMFLQQQAIKQAKHEALDNYFRDFNKSINPAGMRTQDIENGWMGKVNGWMDYYTENKAAIQNPKMDNGKAYNQYMAMHNDLLGDVERSKNEAQKSTQYVVPIVSNPDKRSRLRDNGINAIHLHDTSIYDPNHKSLDPSVLDYSARQFDIAAQKKLDQLAMSGVKMDNMVQGVEIDRKTHNKITTYHAEYSPKTLQTIGYKYADAYTQDDSFANAIDDIVGGSPDVLEQYNQVFKGVFGKDIQSNQDLAAAWGLSRVQSQVNTQKGSTFSPSTNWGFINMMFKQGLANEENIKDFQTLQGVVESKKQNGERVDYDYWTNKPLDNPYTVLNFTPEELSKFGKKINRVIQYDNGAVMGQTVLSNGQVSKEYPLTQADLYMNIGKDLNLGKDLLDAMSQLGQPTKQDQQPQAKPKQSNNDPLGIRHK